VDLSALYRQLAPVLETGRPPRILDAGCGRKTHLEFGDNAYVVGLDVSLEELAENEDVDEKIVGDVQTYPLPAKSFDLIVCWDVLEHVRCPTDALSNLAQALDDSGALVVKIPNVASLKGLATKVTPMFIHRWAYRKLTPWAKLDPFKTYLRWSMAPQQITEWAEREGFDVTHLDTWEAPIQRRLREWLHLEGRAWAAFRSVIRVLTRGRIDAQATEYLIVLHRRSNTAKTS
jgi:SAM-dependent methyltransferase